ncbi:MAG: vitamin B12 dependent-methionine synthase activation domain-containing protein, partial [Luteolibacter sp.]
VPCDKILDKAVEIGADVIGLSGLITPSLDEMVHVAKEMEKRGMKQPLLIGGATTSAAHTAIKIAEHYSGPVIHVLDASRSVPVTTSLLSDKKQSFISENATKQQQIRENYHTGPKKETLTLEQARAAGPAESWDNYQAPVPSFTGTRELTASLAELREYIDWTPFFHAWELRGVWDRQEKKLKTKNAEGAVEASKLYQEAQGWIDRIITENRFEARGIYGFFPANSIADDIIVWSDDSRTDERCRLHTLRQQIKKDSGKPNVALSDWIAPGQMTDYVGGFVVGIHGADEFASELEQQNDPYGSIMVKAIADRFAEAFAEHLHHRARVDWGYESESELTHDQLIHENYRGIRPAPGYPAQPDHTEKPILFDLLGASSATGVTLTESCAMHPGAAVCGLYLSHPQSHYFVISELQKDQLEDYAKRKGISLEEAEKWLGPWLGYAP